MVKSGAPSASSDATSMTQSHQAPCCSGDGEAFPFYQFIRGGFRFAVRVFYGGVVCDQDAANLPPIGEPSLLCFNHPNGLVDSMALMVACPRMIRFIAKDTLWKIPFIGWLVRGAAAVPVKRRQDHGHTTATEQSESQEGVWDAWKRGHIVGVSPEGGSAMRTMLKKPLKKGYLYWLVDSVFQNWEDEDYKVHVVPSGIVFLHPFSWRSEVLVRFGHSFPVDRSILQRHGATEEMRNLDPSHEQRRKVAHSVVNDLVKRIEVAMDELVINIPPPRQQSGAPEEVEAPRVIEVAEDLEGDWVALRSGIIAARILYPKGAEQVSLRKWIDLIKHFGNELQQATHEALEDKLLDYYQDLKHHGLSDARVHEVTDCGRPATCPLLCWFMLKLLQGFLLFACALPGVVCWFPLWLLCRFTEHIFVRKGRIVCDGAVTRRGSNFDLIASAELSLGFMYFVAVCATAGVLMIRWIPSLTGVTGWIGIAASCIAGLLVACLLFPGLIVMSMRLCECGMVVARAARELKCLLCIKERDMQELEATRSELHGLLLPMVTDSVNVLLRSETRLDLAPRWSVWKRRKSDWHESFLTEDLTWSGLVGESGARGSGLVMPLLQHGS